MTCLILHHQKYLLPALAPPTETELSAAQDALTAKYDQAALILAALQTDTQDIKSTLQDQCEKVDESVQHVTSALSAVTTKDEAREEELKTIRDEVESMKALMHKVGSHIHTHPTLAPG